MNQLIFFLAGLEEWRCIKNIANIIWPKSALQLKRVYRLPIRDGNDAVIKLTGDIYDGL